MEENMQGESSMDEKAFLLQEIRYSKRKQNVKSSCAMKATEVAVARLRQGGAGGFGFFTLYSGLFWQFYVSGSWRHLYGNEEMYHGTGSTADRPFRVSGTDRDGIWAYWKRG